MKSNFYTLWLRHFGWICVAAVGLSGCASVSEKMTNLLSSNAEAIGVFDGRILRGQANFKGERVASVYLQSSDTPTLTCLGQLSFTATSTGVVLFSCSDARSVMVQFHALSTLSGTGRSASGESALAFTYGLVPERAAGFLGVGVDRLVIAKTGTPVPNGER